MPRLCSVFRLPLFVMLALLGLGSVAWAKPKASIFGLEVINLGAGAVGAQDTANAATLTDALRNGSSPKFELTSDKRELQDEKLMGNCQNEAAGCMSALARGADFLILGNIEKKTHDGKEAYWIKVRVLNAKSKAYEPDKWQGHLPVSALKSPNQLKEWAGRVHEALAGETQVSPNPKPNPPPGRVDGKLIVTIRNAKVGNVLVDGEKKGELAEGTLTLTLPAGSHDVAIEAKERKRYEKTVTIASGETQTIEAEMDELVGQAPPAKGSNKKIWRAVTWSSVGLGLAGGGVWVYGFVKKRQTEDDYDKCFNVPVDQGGCPKGTKASDDFIKDGKDRERLTWIGGTVVGVAGALLIISAWQGYIADPPAEKTTSSRSKRKRREFAVTPVVSPSGGGATLRFDW